MRDRRPATRTRQAAAALVATVSLLALVVYGDGPAAAHASLVGATPADGSTVRSAPARITLRFDENIRTPAVVIVAGPDGFAEGASPSYVSDFLATSEGLALTKAFTRITDSKLRRSIVDLVEQIAAREGPDKR